MFRITTSVRDTEVSHYTKVRGRVIWGGGGWFHRERSPLPTHSEATAIQSFPLTISKVSLVPQHPFPISTSDSSTSRPMILTADSQVQPPLVPPAVTASSSAVAPHSFCSSHMGLGSIPQTRQALPHLRALLVPSSGSFISGSTSPS